MPKDDARYLQLEDPDRTALVSFISLGVVVRVEVTVGEDGCRRVDVDMTAAESQTSSTFQVGFYSKVFDPYEAEPADTDDEEPDEDSNVVVTASPFDVDEDLPWAYSPNGFCNWVWEVLLEGYKHGTSVPDLDEAIEIAIDQGFTIERGGEELYPGYGSVRDTQD